MVTAPGAYVLSGGTEAAAFIAYADEETDTADDVNLQSSFEYKEYHSHKTYRQVLRIRMPDVYKKLSSGMDDDETVPIPGMLNTCASTDGSIMSDSYIPQGICSTDTYWLVTAYDAGKKYPSVIYMIDSREKQLVSTILLPNKYHVGGIAFDGERVWLTGDTSDRYKGRPFVQYIRYDDLLELTGERVAEVTEDGISENIYIKNKPSFLECDGGKLWVGTYIGTKETKEGYVYGYSINDTEEGDILNTTLFSVITAIDSSAQGMDIEGNYLYVSSSYKGDSPSIKSSFITKYEISPIVNGMPQLYVEDRELSRDIYRGQPAPYQFRIRCVKMEKPGDTDRQNTCGKQAVIF